MRKGLWRRCCTCRTAPVKQNGPAEHSAAPRPPDGAGHVADRACGHGYPRAADPLLGARWRAVARDRTLVVPSALYVAEDGWLFVPFWAPYLYYACRAQ